MGVAIDCQHGVAACSEEPSMPPSAAGQVQHGLGAIDPAAKAGDPRRRGAVCVARLHQVAAVVTVR